MLSISYATLYFTDLSTAILDRTIYRGIEYNCKEFIMDCDGTENGPNIFEDEQW